MEVCPPSDTTRPPRFVCPGADPAGVSGDEAEVKSVKEGDTVILNTGVTKGPNDTVRWYFNDTLIGLINGIICFYDGERGVFRDRLMGDCKTGSLIITNTATEHTGPYEAEIIRRDSSAKTQSLKRNPKCDSMKNIKKNINPENIIKSIILTVRDSNADKNEKESQKEQQDKNIDGRSGLSPGVVAVIGVLLWAVGGGVGFFVGFVFSVKIRRWWFSRKEMKENKRMLQQVFKAETPNEISRMT